MIRLVLAAFIALVLGLGQLAGLEASKPIVKALAAAMEGSR